MPEQEFKVRVVSSYIYEKGTGPQEQMGKSNRWYKGFIRSLIKAGMDINKLDVDFIGLSVNRREDEKIVNELKAQGVSLVICPGTDAAIRWSNIEKEIPTIYFGAHPENNGIELHERENVCGIRLNLPLIWSSRNFNLLSRLSPKTKRIYFPINLESEFVFDNVRSLYQSFKRECEEKWIPHGSHYTGHRSVTFLAESMGCEYFEGPYTGLEELEALLEEIRDVEDKVLVGFNDTTLVPGAIDLISHYVTDAAVPLFWVNNLPVIQACGVGDFSSDFYKVGLKVGELTNQILRNGKSPVELGLHPDQGQKTGLNLARCRALDLEITDDIAAEFDIVS